MVGSRGQPGGEKAAAEARLLYSVPLEPLKRLKRYALGSAVSCWIIFILFGIVLSTSGWESPLYWATGWASVASSTIVCLSLPWWSPYTRRALSFYAAGALVRVPMFAMYLVTGVALVAAILPAISTGWVFAGFVAGLALLPSAVNRHRRSLQQAVEEGHLGRSLDRAEARWDPRFDMDQILRDPRRMRPGFWWRLTFWIGPAIGMSLADVIGRISALLVVGLLAISVGYGSLMAIVSQNAAIVLELRRLEAELGKPIHLAT